MNAQTKTVGVRELRGKLSEYLRRVAAGENFDIVVRGKKVAELRTSPPERENWPSADPESPNFRKPGALKGRVWMADDWETWTDEELAVFEGRENDPLFTLSAPKP